MPAAYALEVYRGDTYQWQFVLWQDAAQTIPYDLSTVTAKAEIRDQPGGLLIVPLTLTVILPNAIEATLDAAHSSQLPVPGAFWDLQLTSATGWVTTVIAGAVKVTADVTDSTPAAAQAMRVRLVA